MNNILVVGGAGYVGGYLVDAIINDRNFSHRLNNHVTVYDNLTYEDRYLKDVDFVYGDIRDYQKLLTVIESRGITTIIWLAALVGDPACAINPKLTHEINCESLKPILKEFSGKFIFMSTASVYGARDGILDETSPTNPLSEYAKSKLAAEDLVRNAESSLIFRLGTLFGVGDSHSRVRLDLVVNALSKRAAMGETLKVFGGAQWRPLLHVRDVSRAIRMGMDMRINGIFNLHNENYTISQIADHIQKVVGCQVELNDIKFEDMRNYQLSSNVYRAFGWQPTIHIQTGIREIVSLIQNNRLKDVNSYEYTNVGVLQRELNNA